MLDGVPADARGSVTIVDEQMGGHSMTNRREFIQAAAITALPVVVGANQVADRAQTNAPTRIDVHAVLVDERHPAARAVGARLAAGGAPVHAIPDGDITQVWLRHIDPVWKLQPVPVAGLTARPALFCLEQLALSCGLRVVFHGEHVVHDEGRTEHRLLRGAQAAGLSTRDLNRAGPLWPSLIADSMATHRERNSRARFGPSSAALAPSLPDGAQLLTSWIIAAA